MNGRWFIRCEVLHLALLREEVARVCSVSFWDVETGYGAVILPPDASHAQVETLEFRVQSKYQVDVEYHFQKAEVA